MLLTRRSFLSRNLYSGAAFGLGGLLLPVCSRAADGAEAMDGRAELESLFATWSDALLAAQIGQDADRESAGALACPGCGIVHGRCGDAIYPLLRRARITGDQRYADAAVRLFDWMAVVDKGDGGWINNLKPENKWDGITVFTLITLCEALYYHGDMLPVAVRERMHARARTAADFVALKNPDLISSGNVNYPATACYALALAAKVLDMPQHRDQARRLAHEILTRITPRDGLLFGEGKPQDHITSRGHYAVDLGYNVEESLQGLSLYALLEHDAPIRAAAVRAWRAHLPFMLPDGAWDNSWGTRMYKWTWWGSRTADGCEPALFALADQDPLFAAAAWRNLRLQHACTHGGLLHGGPHLASHGLKSCIHHTFCHAKALAATLDLLPTLPRDPGLRLPRETADGVRSFPDVGVLHADRAPWRATFCTGDWIYANGKSFHATGATPGMVWHDAVGALFAASTADYIKHEPTNMAVLPDCGDEPLTLRVEARNGDRSWTNLYDLTATLDYQDDGKLLRAAGAARLLASGKADAEVAGSCRLAYAMDHNAFTINATPGERQREGTWALILPLVSPTGEAVERLSDAAIAVRKPKGGVVVSATAPLKWSGPERVFNHVPGFEAVKLSADIPDAGVTVTVRVEA
jgi:hypothetical protein